jgi:mannose-6-phosphate isomerase
VTDVAPGVVHALRAPLRFEPVYKTLVWGGRRMHAIRRLSQGATLPDEPIGESWDLADHADGMSVVATGGLRGTTLSALVQQAGVALVGARFVGAAFPLMVKLIDATERLSLQVHPDDAGARRLGVGSNGKSECWRVLADGGVVFQGTRPGVDRAGFERALAAGTITDVLNRFDAHAGDGFFLPARTVHALGEGCLVYEIQQTSNVTFRVHDWGRLGLDGKPRQLHLRESLDTIDFSDAGAGPLRPKFTADARGGQTAVVVECPYFRLEERRGGHLAGGAGDGCSIVITLSGTGTIATAGGQMAIGPMQTVLVPAVAGAWTVAAEGGDDLVVLVAEPRFQSPAV